MENYIIRIYRRDKNKPNQVAGVIEFVETEKKETFKSTDELIQILRTPKRKKSPKRKKPGRASKKK